MDKLFFGCVLVVCSFMSVIATYHGIGFTPSQTALLEKTDADSVVCEWCSCTANETILSTKSAQDCGSQLNELLTKDGSPRLAIDSEYWISHIKCSSTKSDTPPECNFIGLSEHVHSPPQESSDHLAWTIPVITLVLIAMAVGGYMLHRHTEKKGYNQYIVDGADKQEVEA